MPINKRFPWICGCLLWLVSGGAIQAQESIGHVPGDTHLAVQDTVRISGTVRHAETGLPLAGESVSARDGFGNVRLSALTDSAGRYQIDQLRPGSYKVTAGGNSELLMELYPDLICRSPRRCDWSSGTTLELEAGSEIDGVDFELDPGGSLTGRVTLSTTGEPGAGVRIWVQKTDTFFERYSDLDADGRFEIRGLYGGDYWVYAPALGIFASGVGVVYPGVICDKYQCPIELGTPVPVEIGEQTSGIDFQLRGFSRIAGRITETGSGAPLADIRLTLWTADAEFPEFARTDSDGFYSYDRLFPETYFLRAGHPDYLDERYDNISCALVGQPCPMGTPIELPLEAEATDIDFQLDRGGRIEGTVTDRTGEPVSQPAGIAIFDASGDIAQYSDYDVSTGIWRSFPLPPGTYTAQTRADFDFANVIWNGRVCDTVWRECPTTTGDAIEVFSNETITGIDFVLPRLGKISGTVIDAETGEAVSGRIQLWSENGELLDTKFLDSNDGTFELEHLRLGTYYLTTLAHDGHLDRVHGGGICFGPDCDPTSGTPLVIEYDQVLDGIVIPLEPGGEISGTLFDDTGAPQSDWIWLYDTQGRFLRQSRSDSAGSWTLNGLAAGSYFIQALESSFGEFYHQIWGGGHCYHSCDPTRGAVIQLAERGSVTGIDIVFDERFGSLQGVLTHAETGEPVPGILMRKWAEPSVETATTDSEGRYIFTRVTDAPLQLSTAGAPDWLDQVWPEIPCPPTGCEQLLDQGQTVVVPADTELTGFDFALEADQGCEDPSALCLGDNRFRAFATWNSEDNQGVGTAIPLTTDSGYFHFFSPDNVEILVKVLDGCFVNGAYWLFAAGLTNLEVELTVQDLVSGVERQYTSQNGQIFAPIQDIRAFYDCPGSIPIVESPERVTTTTPATELAKGLGCVPDGTTACLNEGRFRVEMIRDTSTEDPRPAFAEMLTSDTAYFWFFTSNNVEILVKVLDACDTFDQFWIFTSGLTNVGTTLTITDTQTGQVWTRETQLDQPYPPAIETEVFSCP